MSLADFCIPRKTVFQKDRRDIVLDLKDLLCDKINPYTFFDENYITEGMKFLFEKVFEKFSELKDIASVFMLTQSMGGGKTHNMIALGLLAKFPEIRKKIFKSLNIPDYEKTIRVVGFNGRESDAPFGIWGSIAEQIGKKELFKDYYSLLKAPGQSAWMNL